MEKLIEMVGEKIKITSGDESVDATMRSVNKEGDGTWTLAVTAAEKELSPFALVRGWLGHLSVCGAFGLRVPKDSTKCTICGKKIEGSDGRLKQHISNYEALRAVKWIDVTRPIGDHEKWAHPKCLHAVRYDKSQWPAGLCFVESPESVDLKRQDAAVKVLKEKGHDLYTACRAVAWEKGKEPAIIGQLLDVEKLVPEVGDVISIWALGGSWNIVNIGEHPLHSGALLTLLNTDGARKAQSLGTKGVTLLVRNGKVVNKAYTL